jgi:hypothetical protein
MKTTRVAIAAGAAALIASLAAAGGLPGVPSPSQRWYRVDVMGRHAGWASETIADRKGPDGPLRVVESELLVHVVWETDAQVTLKVGPDEFTAPRHFRIDFRQSIRARTEYDARGFLRSDFRVVERKAKRRVVVERTEAGFDVAVTSGKDALRRSVAASDVEATSNALYEVPGRWAKDGDAATLRVLDLATGEVVPRTFRLAGREDVTVRGVAGRARRFDVSDEKEAFRVWVDDAGLEVRLEQTTGKTTVLFEQSDEKAARDFTPPSFDLDAGDEVPTDLRDSV